MSFKVDGSKMKKVTDVIESELKKPINMCEILIMSSIVLSESIARTLDPNDKKHSSAT